MDKIAVIIPFFNGEPYIERCLSSILANGLVEQQIYIVDNSLQENALGNVLTNYPRVNVIRTRPSIGFGGACNIGARSACEYGATELVFINQDIILDDACISELVGCLRAVPTLALVAPLNYTYDFSAMEAFFIRHYLTQCPSLVVDAIKGTFKDLYDVKKIMGSCFAAKVSFINQIGLFDDIYFMYAEDEDLCRRTRLVGGRIALNPRARVAHAHSHTANDRELKVEMWERKSQRLYDLKDIEISFWRTLIGAIRLSLLDYFRFATGLHLKTLTLSIMADAHTAIMIPRILRSRLKEKQLVNHLTTLMDSSMLNLGALNRVGSKPESLAGTEHSDMDETADKTRETMVKIDQAAKGFLGCAPDADRYGHTYSPYAASGIISQFVPEHSRVLDVGCGNGSLAEILQSRRVAQVFGIEPDASRAEIARSRGIEVYCGFLSENFHKKYSSFDVVLFADVLEHVPDPLQLIEHGLTCLKENGSIVLSVPNVVHWSVRSMILRGRFQYEPVGILDATHLRWFTRETITQLVDRAGLRIVESRVSSGTAMTVYKSWPWAWMPSSVVWHSVVQLSKLWPSMFGCQIIVRAVRR